MSEVELKIKSSNIEKTTASIEAMITQLEKLQTAEGGVSGSGEKLTSQQKKVEAALKSSTIAAEKSSAMLRLEKQGLDQTSDAYAKKKAGILAAEQASKKSIDTGSKEYQALLKNITARERDIATTKRLADAQKAALKAKNAAAHETKELGGFTKVFSDNLSSATKQVQLIDGPLGGIASRMTALNGIIKGGSLALAGFGLGLGLATHQLSGGITVAADTEVVLKGLEAQLRATGYSSGQTASELDDLARSLAFATLDNSQGVREIISTLLTFKSVSTDVFKSATELAMDMGIAMKQDPVSAAKLLGKVLEDPINNYKQLRRSGIAFNKEEKELMATLQAKGELQQAQAIILGKVEERYKGVARAQADTLRGDIDTFGQLWEQLWEGLGEKLIPRLRTTVQLASQLVTVFTSLSESGTDKEINLWSASLSNADLSIKQLEGGIADFDRKIAESKENQASWAASWRDSVVNSVSFMGLLLNAGVPESVMRTEMEEQLVLLEAKKQKLEELLVAQKGQLQSEKMLTEEQLDALENSEIELRQQVELTAAYLATGDSRSEKYREAKVLIDSENAARKVGLQIGSEEELQLRSAIRSLSDMTESRVRHNTALQKQKSLQSKQEDLQREIDLMRLVEGGLRKNSEEYILAGAAIDARNQAQRAGFAVGSAEYEMILKETEALALLQAEMQKAADMSRAGIKTGIGGGEVSTSGADADFNKMLGEMELLRSLDLENQELYEQKLQDIKDKYHEMSKNKMEQLGITMTEEGREVLLSSDEALFIERDEKLKELETARREGFISDETVYLERRNELTSEYDQRAIDQKAAQWEASAEHKRNMEQVELSNTIKSGIDNLASVKKNNRALAVMSKAAAIYSAGVSFVDGLSAANALPYPANIPAYAKAFVQGTALIQQASSLTAPSYAFGGVDIGGAGTGRSDSIQANIARGESVITAPATAQHRETLKRMNQGLPIGGSGTKGTNVALSINISGDASERTVGLIEAQLLSFETRVAQISQQVSTTSIQNENEIGGILNPI